MMFNNKQQQANVDLKKKKNFDWGKLHVCVKTSVEGVDLREEARKVCEALHSKKTEVSVPAVSD